MAAEAQADTGNQEYLTDVAYLRNFVDDLSPARLRLVAALNGFLPPPAQDFDYCELGAGNGDTLATLAAAYPRARFVGVDFNPEHVAFANVLARRGGLGNVDVLERDFEALGQAALPDFDFICAHGVMSWIGPAKRKAILEFAGAKLKPGGVLYVSYNALPGWAAVEPLRRLMLDSAGSGEGSSLERARRGLGVARLLSEAGADYFTSNPATRTMLATMMKMGLPYVAHEYFHAHWQPMYFADVAREMAASGLYFVGQLPLYLNYRDLSIAPSLLPLFKDVSDRVAFESLKDFAVNESFRRDVYVKGVVPCSEANTRAYFDGTAFGPPASGGSIQRDVRLPHYTLQFVGPIFDALVPALSEASATVSELALRPALAAFGVQRIRDAVRRLALGEQVSPMQEPTLPARASPTGLYEVPLAYNRMILQQRLSNESPIVLASPVAGTGLVVPMLAAVCLRVVTEVPPAERSEWIRAFVGRHPLLVRDGERAIADKEEQQRLLEHELAQFIATRLPELRKLGILEER